MSSGGRRRSPDEESFADLAGDDVVPLPGREDLRAPPTPKRGPASRPGREPVPFVREEEGGGRAADVALRTLWRLRRGDPAPELEIDLHGLDLHEAEERVGRDLTAARDEGARCVLVIHGRGHHSEGAAVLRRDLPEWLIRPPLDRLVLAFCRAPERLGGSGATLVLLRRRRQRAAKRPR